MKNHQNLEFNIALRSNKTSKSAYFHYHKYFIKDIRILILPVFFLLILVSCSNSNSYSGRNYNAQNSSKYIKFINSNTIEWKWAEEFRAEEFEYTIEDNKVRTVRKLFGLGQIKYIEILDNDKLEDPEGDIYSQ